MAQLIDGKELAKEVRAEVKARAEAFRATHNRAPGLDVVLVGDDPASQVYVRNKERAASKAGIAGRVHRLPAETSEADLLALIFELNGADEIDGILVQLPLPKHIDESRIISAILPEKDVDGFHPQSVGKMVLGQDTFLPCTPAGVIEILYRSGVTIPGSHVVIVGRSAIVGKPLANLLLQRGPRGNATVTVCHTGTEDISRHTLQADILIAAAGVPEMISGNMIKPGAVVIDVGVNRIPDTTKKSGFRLVGDVNFGEAREVSSRITPVPGGVGPLTITMLMANTVRSAQRRESRIRK